MCSVPGVGKGCTVISTASPATINYFIPSSSTYDHRTLKTRLPVRSAIYKQCTGGLVVRWVTTSESPLLYVFAFFVKHPHFDIVGDDHG